jgi:hypothetical protein
VRIYKGLPAFPGFAIGPAHVVHTWNDLVATAEVPMPVIVVAPYLEPRMVDIVELRRVYGFVIERGSLIDPIWEKLREVTKASVVGCKGAYAEIQPGEMIGIDGEDGVAVASPKDAAIKYFQQMKGERAARLNDLELQTLDRFISTIRTAWLHTQQRPPLDLDDAGRRLFAIARQVAAGEPPGPGDDDYVRGLIESPPPAEPPEDHPFWKLAPKLED